MMGSVKHLVTMDEYSLLPAFVAVITVARQMNLSNINTADKKWFPQAPHQLKIDSRPLQISRSRESGITSVLP